MNKKGWYKVQLVLLTWKIYSCRGLGKHRCQILLWQSSSRSLPGHRHQCGWIWRTWKNGERIHSCRTGEAESHSMCFHQIGIRNSKRMERIINSFYWNDHKRKELKLSLLKLSVVNRETVVPKVKWLTHVIETVVKVRQSECLISYTVWSVVFINVT